MSFRLKDDSVLMEYNEIQNRIKGLLAIKFHSKLVYQNKYIKTKVKTFDGLVNAIFWNDKIPQEGIHYTCIAAINVDSVMKLFNYPQVHLKEWRYKIKKKITRFIDAELELHDSDGSDSEQLLTGNDAREPQTYQDPEESGLTLEQHSWCLEQHSWCQYFTLI